MGTRVGRRIIARRWSGHLKSALMPSNHTTQLLRRLLFWSLLPGLDLQATGATIRSQHHFRADNLNRNWPSYTSSNNNTSSSNITSNSNNAMEAQHLKHRRVASLRHRHTAHPQSSNSRNLPTCNNHRRHLSLNSSLCSHLPHNTNRMRILQHLLRHSKADTTTTSQHRRTSTSTLLLLKPMAIPTGQAVTGP